MMAIKKTTKAKSQEAIFKKSIAPTLEKLVTLCHKHGIPMYFAAQILDEANKERVLSESLYQSDPTNIFRIMALLSSGALSVVDLGDGDFFLREATPPATELNKLQTLAEHAEECDECREEMERRLALGEDLSNIRIMEDEHGIPVKLPSIPFILPFNGKIH